MPLPLLIGLGVAAAAAAVAAVAMSDDNSSSDNHQARLNAENEEKREKAKRDAENAAIKAKREAREKLFVTGILALATQYSFSVDEKKIWKNLVSDRSNLLKLQSNIENTWQRTEVFQKLTQEIKALSFKEEQLNANLKCLKEMTNA
ncbi:hypothetical protein [Acinetobacter modestus]|uniref:hypothetical protein n=1 Tax=Acinetobacter modestus TaxID=1776740 RepID=UPI0032093DBE